MHSGPCRRVCIPESARKEGVVVRHLVPRADRRGFCVSRDVAVTNPRGSQRNGPARRRGKRRTRRTGCLSLGRRDLIEPATDTPETLNLNASVGWIPSRHSTAKHRPPGAQRGFLGRPASAAVSWKTSIHASMELDPELDPQVREHRPSAFWKKPALIGRQGLPAPDPERHPTKR
jgi:hypothetical protein